MCGVTIGKYAMVGAGAVVLDSIPNFALVVGNPGRIIGWVNKKGKRLKFKQNGKSICGDYEYNGEIVSLSENDWKY